MKDDNEENEVHIKGYVAWPAETRCTAAGCPLCQFCIKYTYTRKGKEKPYMFEVAYFGDIAQEIAPLLVTGKHVEVFGRLEQDIWTDHSGKVRSKTKIVAQRIELLDDEFVNNFACSGD